MGTFSAAEQTCLKWKQAGTEEPRDLEDGCQAAARRIWDLHFHQTYCCHKAKELMGLSDLQAAVLDWAGQGLLVTIMEQIVWDRQQC